MSTVRNLIAREIRFIQESLKREKYFKAQYWNHSNKEKPEETKVQYREFKKASNRVNQLKSRIKRLKDKAILVKKLGI